MFLYIGCAFCGHGKLRKKAVKFLRLVVLVSGLRKAPVGKVTPGGKVGAGDESGSAEES
jgi:hypothetical protein